MQQHTHQTTQLLLFVLFCFFFPFGPPQVLKHPNYEPGLDSTAMELVVTAAEAATATEYVLMVRATAYNVHAAGLAHILVLNCISFGQGIELD